MTKCINEILMRAVLILSALKKWKRPSITFKIKILKRPFRKVRVRKF